MLAIASALAALVSPAPGPVSPAYQKLGLARVIDPRTGGLASPLDDVSGKRACVVLLPQLGDFDSVELSEQLVAVKDDLEEAGVALRVIGIGSTGAAERFSRFTGLPLDNLRVDPDGAVHKALQLHAGPGWSVPDGVPDALLKLLLATLPGGAPADEAKLRPVATAWLRYLAMCSGIASPGTLREILRGYLGDSSAPERLAPEEVVSAGPVSIGPGVGPVKLGPFRYTSSWADERGYQRPVELATVRLKAMVEALGNWDEYVGPEPLAIAQRGATYIFDADGVAEYEYAHRGVLTYSETMSRPLSFLSGLIGEARARNPLGLRDDDRPSSAPPVRGRGPLKAAGKAMGLLAPVFRAENQLQAEAVGADARERSEARQEVRRAIEQSPAVVYTYGLSPFSTEATALLDAAGASYEKVELGLEWFLLGKRASATRAELLEMTGQSSLPHVFIGGEHVGGLFTGPAGAPGGLAGLQESGDLDRMLVEAGSKIGKS